MKAVRFHGIGDVRCDEVNEPQIKAPDDVLIRVLYAGICGSDLHIYRKALFEMNIPQIMGHEYVGLVDAVGSAVKGLRPGDYVVQNPMLYCGECESCLSGNQNTCGTLSFIGEMSEGCFAPLIVSKASSLVPVKAGKENVKCLALAEPLAVALNICKRAHLGHGDKLAVVGAGPIGLLTIAAAKQLFGAGYVAAVDLLPERLDLAVKAGADETFTALPTAMTFNKIIDAAGVAASFSQGITHLSPGGTLFIVSIFEDELCCDINAIVSGQLAVTGCNAYTQKDLEEAATFLSSGKISADFVITHEFSVDDCKEAFSMLAGGDKRAAKILFHMY